jgi:acetoin utilization deacetylase AcuC-like enzyme
MPLPPGHRFPQPKYRLLREAVEAAGLGDVWHAGPVPWAALEAVHDPGYLRALRDGALDRRAERVLGLPWSRELVERARRSVQATVQAAGDALDDGIGMNLGGGTHHAGRAAARGYCVLNDVPVTIAGLRAAGRARRFLVVDCDVHQGDGTAEMLAGDPDAYTLSVHGGANYPFKRATSDLDVDLRSGTGDDEYLAALEGALATAFAAARPELVFYLAGADPWEGDRLGRLALTKPGLLARDEMVLDATASAGAAACVCLAGGYAPDIRDTVEINLATARLVASRETHEAQTVSRYMYRATQ